MRFIGFLLVMGVVLLVSLALLAVAGGAGGKHRGGWLPGTGTGRGDRDGDDELVALDIVSDGSLDGRIGGGPAAPGQADD